jgi:hypothetical protein
MGPASASGSFFQNAGSSCEWGRQEPRPKISGKAPTGVSAHRRSFPGCHGSGRERKGDSWAGRSGFVPANSDYAGESVHRAGGAEYAGGRRITGFTTWWPGKFLPIIRRSPVMPFRWNAVPHVGLVSETQTYGGRCRSNWPETGIN